MTTVPVVLDDPQLNRQLHRDGFVKFRLLDAAAVVPLRSAFLDMVGPTPGGFHSDLVIPDPAYRRRTDQVIADALDGPVGARFVGFQPFLRNFLCKFPGAANDLYLHQDWMYVDEREGRRTYVAWVALEDIDGDNGQFELLRSSHRLSPALRGTDLVAPWLGHTEVIAPRLLWIPVGAGECVVFDNSLVHCSAPNTTGTPRVAAAVGMKRVTDPLVYFRRDDDNTATMFGVDSEFFLTETPQGLAAEAPSRAVLERVRLTASDLSPSELRRRLDRPPLAKLDRIHRTAKRVREVMSRGRVSAEALRARAARGGAERRSKAAIAILAANEWAIDRFGPTTPAVWDPGSFPWTAAVEESYADIRREVEALLDGPTEMPHIEDVTGGIPQGNEGAWRSFVLMHQGQWIDWNCERCPATAAVVRGIPGLTMAGFSLLEPGTHITEHRGPNKGALRYQLGVVVPGEDGACRIRVGDEMLHWHDGKSVMFDFTVVHEAWNDTDADRVLLMLEVVTPLPWYLAGPNRLAQRAMSWFPTTRDMAARLRALEPQLVKADPVPVVDRAVNVDRVSPNI